MAEKLMTDGSMALREKQYRVITIEATEKPQNANCGLRHTPVSAPPLMTSSTPSPPRTVTTVT